MLFSTLLFYIFSLVLLASSLVVISARNPVHSVMFLILAFFNASGLFVLLGAEFLAMLLIVVYVGAIAVLFLFVVMMLDIDHGQLKSKFKEYFSLATLLGVILFIEILMILKSSVADTTRIMAKFPIRTEVSNVEAIGKILYTDFIYPFQLAGAILFVAMIGAIVLTIREQKRFIKKQEISKQVSRTKEDSVEIVKVGVGKGINI